MSSDSNAFQSSFSLFSTPLPRLQQLSSLVAPPSQSEANSRSAPRLIINAPKSAGGFAIAAPPSSAPPTYAHVVQRQHSPHGPEQPNHSLEAVASAISAGLPVAPQIARQICPIIPSSVMGPPFPVWYPTVEPTVMPTDLHSLTTPHLSNSSFDQSSHSKAPQLSTSVEFYGSDLWNPNPSQLGWNPWITPDSSQQQQPLSFFGASAMHTLADALIEPSMVLGCGDVLVPADALKQLMAASVSSRAGVALSVQRVGSSLLVNSLTSQDGVSFESIDSLSPFTPLNRTAIACCIRCHLPDAICSCGDVTPRKSIGNGTCPSGTQIPNNSIWIYICAQTSLTVLSQAVWTMCLMICRQLSKDQTLCFLLPSPTVQMRLSTEKLILKVFKSQALANMPVWRSRNLRLQHPLLKALMLM
jgi:hypothetical protein